MDELNVVNIMEQCAKESEHIDTDLELMFGAMVRAIREGKLTDLATHTARWIANNPIPLDLGLKR